MDLIQQCFKCWRKTVLECQTFEVRLFLLLTLRGHRSPPCTVQLFFLCLLIQRDNNPNKAIVLSMRGTVNIKTRENHIDTTFRYRYGPRSKLFGVLICKETILLVAGCVNLSSEEKN